MLEERTLVIDNEREVTSDGAYLFSKPLDEPCKKHIDASRAVIKLAREKSGAWERPPDIILDASQLRKLAAELCEDSYVVSLWFSGGVDQPIIIAEAKGRKERPELGEQEEFAILMPVVLKGVR